MRIFKKGKYYWLDYFDETGKRKRQSTKETNREIAEKIGKIKHKQIEEKKTNIMVEKILENKEEIKELLKFKEMYFLQKKELETDIFYNRAASLNYAYPPFKITSKELEQIYENSKDRCYYCGKKLNGNFDFEHKIPYSRGGFNKKNNIVISCRKCNSEKCSKTADEYFKYLENI